MWARWRNRIYTAGWISLLAACASIFAVEWMYAHDPMNPHVPNPATGHVFYIPIKNSDPIYVTEAQYARVRYLTIYLICAGFGLGALGLADKVILHRRP